MHDVVIAGGGPAGCIAALVLARAGARVLMCDRAAFPRDKLCGDTLNPGALALLRRLGVHVGDEGLAIEGMTVTGPGGAHVTGRYPAGVTGRSLLRKDLDWQLLNRAAQAGAAIEEQCTVTAAVMDGPRRRVSGAALRARSGRVSDVRAHVVIAADGRAAHLARSLGLARHPAQPRRWAVGAYFVGVQGMSSCGEMHVRPGHYIGVAPLRGGLVNVCVVSDEGARLRQAMTALDEVLRNEPALRSRFAPACMVSRPVALGPLAVDCPVAGMPGLLLAGDTAGFVDPMTGDGLRFALRGGELAGAAASHALEHGGADAHLRLTAARRLEFRDKWRFNRALRALAASRTGVRAASVAARISAWPLRRVIDYAGDVTAA